MGRSFPDTQEGELAFNELLAFYGYEASDPLSDPEGESEEFDTSASQDLEQKAKGGVPESGEMPPCGTPSLSPHSTNSLSPACHKEAATPLSLSSEDPQDRTLSPDVGEKEMMVGSQAQLPFLRYTPAGERDYENVDQLLWDPSILPECEVEEYLSRASERQREVWEGSPFDESRVKDNEQALYELVRCRFHTEEALRRLHFNVKVVQDGLCAWSEEERRNFEHGFRVHGKNFNLIQANKVRTRSVGECVQYYYFWKKSERYEYYTQQTRLGKRKLNGNPSAAEYEYEVSELESAVGLHGAIYSGGLGVGASAGTSPQVLQPRCPDIEDRVMSQPLSRPFDLFECQKSGRTPLWHSRS